jgi:hypothetical protein
MAKGFHPILKARLMHSQLNQLAMTFFLTSMLSSKHENNDVMFRQLPRDTITPLLNSDEAFQLPRMLWPSLAKDVLTIVNGDQTFLVKEFEEDVKLFNAENIRLASARKTLIKNTSFMRSCCKTRHIKPYEKSMQCWLSRLRT